MRPKDRAARFLKDLMDKPGTVMGYYSTTDDGKHVGKDWVFEGSTFKVVKSEGKAFPLNEPLSEFTAILVLTADFE
jgi:hypothetical protein